VVTGLLARRQPDLLPLMKLGLQDSRGGSGLGNGEVITHRFFNPGG
jgi:hypothetical protein